MTVIHADFQGKAPPEQQFADDQPRMTFTQAFDFVADVVVEVDGVPRENITLETLISAGVVKKFHARMLSDSIRPKPKMPTGLVWLRNMTVRTLLAQLPLIRSN